ncbi:MAG: DUF5060 domain-containing protein [Chloroflexi bacterium]|nr:DUF5060 domain-containing protein [Chloroflexota bacterium]
MGTGTRGLSVVVVLGLLLGMLAMGGVPRAQADIVVSASAASLPVYDLLELTFDLPDLSIDPDDPAALNPYDPAQVDLWAVITGPDGWVEEVPAFWAGAVTVADLDHITPVTGQGHWQVRYAPRRPGGYAYLLEQRLPSPARYLAAGSFAATPAAVPGYVRLDPQRPTRFVTDDGRAFVPTGVNLAWNDWFSFYPQHLAGLAAAGMNYARVWLPSGSAANFALEWTGNLRISQQIQGQGAGPGRYLATSGYRLDRLLTAARDEGVYLQLTLFTPQQFSDWRANNPYLAPDAPAATFWQDAEARRLARNYVRYVGARYGAYTSLATVEFWNELDQGQFDRPLEAISPWLIAGSTDETAKAALAAWHDEMVTALFRVAPRRPLTATSFAAFGKFSTDNEGRRTFRTLPMLDSVQPHWYSTDPQTVHNWVTDARWAVANTARGYLLGEYGYHDDDAYPPPDQPGPDRPKLRRLNHHALWAPFLIGGTAGPPLLWRLNWWFDPPDDIRPNYSRFSAWLGPELPYLRDLTFQSMDIGETVDGGGYVGPTRALLSFYNRNASWTEDDDSAIAPAAGLTVQAPLTDGSYRVEFTDPQTGDMVDSRDVTAADGQLMLALPTFVRDLAVKVYRPGEAPPAPRPLLDPAAPTPTPTATPTPSATRTPTPTATPPGAPRLTLAANQVTASVSAAGKEPARLVDGNVQTGWETPYSSSAPPASASVTISLGAAVTVDQIRWRVGTATWLQELTVEGSVDGTTFAPLAPSYPVATTGGWGFSWRGLAVPDQPLRAIRLSLVNTGPVGKLGDLQEVEVYGRVADPTATPPATPTPPATWTPTPAMTPTNTLTVTPSVTPADTAVPTPTATDTPSATPTDTPTITPADTPTRTATVTPAVTPTPPALPVLLSPNNGASGVVLGAPTVLHWRDPGLGAAAASHFRLHVRQGGATRLLAERPASAFTVVGSGPSGTEYAYTLTPAELTAFTPNTLYNWQVGGRNGAITYWKNAAQRTFTTGASLTVDTGAATPTVTPPPPASPVATHTPTTIPVWTSTPVATPTTTATVRPTAPPPPALVAPTTTAPAVDRAHAVLDWQDPGEGTAATATRFQVVMKANWATVLTLEVAAADLERVPSVSGPPLYRLRLDALPTPLTLDPSTVHRWQVGARNAANPGYWKTSALAVFTTGP